MFMIHPSKKLLLISLVRYLVIIFSRSRIIILFAIDILTPNFIKYNYHRSMTVIGTWISLCTFIFALLLSAQLHSCLFQN